MNDTATCPECDNTFPVSRYGRKIPCPGCNEPLDISPDTPLGKPGLSEAEWDRALMAHIEYLTAVRDEVLSEQISDAGEYAERLWGQIVTLKLLAKPEN